MVVPVDKGDIDNLELDIWCAPTLRTAKRKYRLSQELGLALSGKQSRADGETGEKWKEILHVAPLLAERFGSGDGEREAAMTRQMPYEPLPASVLFAFGLLGVEGQCHLHSKLIVIGCPSISLRRVSMLNGPQI